MALTYPILDPARYEERFAEWAASASRNHPELVVSPNREIAWSPPARPLSACRVALVTTTGVRRRGDAPFDNRSRWGDWTYRAIPADVDPAELVVDHTHFDSEDAALDINCVFPVTRVRELAAEGVVGGVVPTHYSFMGFIPDPTRGLVESAAAVASALREVGADVAILTPG